MSNVTYSAPAVLLARDNTLHSYCATVVTNGQPIGLNDELTLQPVDPSGASGQVFVYGSDQRIYLYNGSNAPQYCLGFAQPAQDGQPLQVQSPNSQDPTQQWSFSTNNPTLTNVGQPLYSVNDRSGTGSVGDSVAIFPGASGNNSFSWAFVICPQPFPV